MYLFVMLDSGVSIEDMFLALTGTCVSDARVPRPTVVQAVYLTSCLMLFAQRY